MDDNKSGSASASSSITMSSEQFQQLLAAVASGSKHKSSMVRCPVKFSGIKSASEVESFLTAVYVFKKVELIEDEDALTVTKQKLSKEREVLKLRNKERTLTDELNTTKAEVEQLTEQLELLKNQITQSKHQISMIDMCTISEDLKIEAHVEILNAHMAEFQKLFNRDQAELEQRIQEKRDKEAKLQEDIRQKEKQIAEEKQRQMGEATAIEEECQIIERECAVLKKRNNAIMLKLRKRLLEAENTRRMVMKRNAPQMSNNNDADCPQ